LTIILLYFLNQISKESDKEKINNLFFDSDKLSKKTSSIGLHLIVLVHGFQGNAYDMRLIKNTISLINPSIVFMSSRANEDKTENDILEMGKTLANEVRNSFKEWNDIGLIKKYIKKIIFHLKTL